MKTSRRSDVDPFIVMEVFEAASRMEASGRSVVRFEVGQPGTGAPQAARAAVAEALNAGPLGYTQALGLPQLRERIASLYGTWYGVDLDPGRIIVTAGSSGAFLLAFTALFDAGARVGVAEPGYPSYRQILKALDLQPVGVPTQESQDHRMIAAALPDELDGLIVASPSNPTGVILGESPLSDIVEHCRDRGVSFISDEIYHGLHYEERAVSALELSDDVYIINSFSKYFSMTGWRVGWMVVPEDHVRTIERLAQNLFICAPHVGQVAALAAMDCIDELEQNRRVYATNRDILASGLRAAGFTRLTSPDGAFYIYADVTDFSADSVAFADEILREAAVAVTPGLDFDPVRGRQTLRFSYARNTDEIIEGVQRLTAFMRARSFAPGQA